MKKLWDLDMCVRFETKLGDVCEQKRHASAVYGRVSEVGDDERGTAEPAELLLPLVASIVGG
jgi:hypothetical protein